MGRLPQLDKPLSSGSTYVTRDAKQTMTDPSFERHIYDIIDLAEPRMDVYEFAIYMYLVRHTRLLGRNTGTFGFKSIRKTMVIGVGESSKPMSEGTCYLKIRSLATKGFIEILDSTNNGQKVKVFLPLEIVGLVQPITNMLVELDIDKIDFFSVLEYREKILDREQRKCFYCFKTLSNDGYVIEHVVSRPRGDNSYRNLVASCRTCNNKKGKIVAADFIRKLYRENFISEIEFKQIIDNLERLKNGELKPQI